MKKNLGLTLFLIIILGLIFLTYKDYGVAWDEKIFFNTGKYFLVEFLNFFRIKSNLDLGGFVPTPYHLAGHGILYDFLIVAATIFLRTFSFEALHLMKALFSLPIFIIVYFIVKKILNSRLAIVSLFLLLFFPRFYADIFVNAIDIPTALFFALNLWYFFYYLKSGSSFKKDIIFGLILATAVTHRLLLFYLFPLNLIFIFLNLFFEKKLKLGRFVLSQTLIFVSLLFFLHLFHPLLFTKPLAGFIDLLTLTKKYPWNAAVLFDGKWYQAGVAPLPWYYIPKSMLITIPLVTLALFLIGQIRLIRQIRLTYAYLLLVFYLPLILTFILKPTLYDSWRHYMFLTVPIVVIAAFGIEGLINISKSQFSISNKFPIIKLVIGNWSLAIGLLVFIGFLTTGATMARLHPYEYLYYNSLIGGLKGAAGRYETDYWGLGYKEAVQWFNKNINVKNKTYKIWVEGDPLSSSYYFESNMRLALSPEEADYIITFTRWNFHVRHPGKTIYKVVKDGVAIIYIKKL